MAEHALFQSLTPRHTALLTLSQFVYTQTASILNHDTPFQIETVLTELAPAVCLLNDILRGSLKQFTLVAQSEVSTNILDQLELPIDTAIPSWILAKNVLPKLSGSPVKVSAFTTSIPNIFPLIDQLWDFMMVKKEDGADFPPSALSFPYFVEVVWNVVLTGPLFLNVGRSSMMETFGIKPWLFPNVEQEIIERTFDRLVVLIVYSDLVRNICRFSLSLLYRESGLGGALLNWDRRMKTEPNFKALLSPLYPVDITRSLNHVASFYLNLVVLEATPVPTLPNDDIWSSYKGWGGILSLDQDLEGRIFDTTHPDDYKPQQRPEFHLERSDSWVGTFLRTKSIQMADFNSVLLKPMVPIQLYHQKADITAVVIDTLAWPGFDTLVDGAFIQCFTNPRVSKTWSIQKMASNVVFVHGNDIMPSLDIAIKLLNHSSFQAESIDTILANATPQHIYQDFDDLLRGASSFRRSKGLLDQLGTMLVKSAQWSKALEQEYKHIVRIDHLYMEAGFLVVATDEGLTFLSEVDLISRLRSGEVFNNLTIFLPMPLKYPDDQLAIGGGFDSLRGNDPEQLQEILQQLIDPIFKGKIATMSQAYLETHLENENRVRRILHRFNQLVDLLGSYNGITSWIWVICPILEITDQLPTVISSTDSQISSIEIDLANSTESLARIERNYYCNPSLEIKLQPKLISAEDNDGNLKFVEQSFDDLLRDPSLWLKGNDDLPGLILSVHPTPLLPKELFRAWINEVSTRLNNQTTLRKWYLFNPATIPISGLRFTFDQKVITDTRTIHRLNNERTVRQLFNLDETREKEVKEDAPTTSNILHPHQFTISFDSALVDTKKGTVDPLLGALLKYTGTETPLLYHLYYKVGNTLGTKEAGPYWSQNAFSKVSDIFFGSYSHWAELPVQGSGDDKSVFKMTTNVHVSAANLILGIGTTFACLSNLSLSPNELRLFTTFDNIRYCPSNSLLDKVITTRWQSLQTIGTNEENFLLGGDSFPKNYTPQDDNLSKIGPFTDNTLATVPLYTLPDPQTPRLPNWDGFKAAIYAPLEIRNDRVKPIYRFLPKGTECTYPLLSPLFTEANQQLFTDSLIYVPQSGPLFSKLRAGITRKEVVLDTSQLDPDWVANYQEASLGESVSKTALLADALKTHQVNYEPLALFYPGLYYESVTAAATSITPRTFPKLLFEKEFHETKDNVPMYQMFYWLPLSFYKLKQQLLGWTENTTETTNYSLPEFGLTRSGYEKRQPVLDKDNIQPTVQDYTLMGTTDTQLYTRPVVHIGSKSNSDFYLKVHCHKSTSDEDLKIPDEPTVRTLDNQERQKRAHRYMTETVTNSASLNPASIPIPLCLPQSVSTNALFKHRRVLVHGGLENDPAINRYIDVGCEILSTSETELEFMWKDFLLAEGAQFGADYDLLQTSCLPICNKVVHIGSTPLSLIARAIPAGYFQAQTKSANLLGKTPVALPLMGAHSVPKKVKMPDVPHPWRPHWSEDVTLLISWKQASTDVSQVGSPEPGGVPAPKSGLILIQALNTKNAIEETPIDFTGNAYQRTSFRRRLSLNQLATSTLDNKTFMANQKTLNQVSDYYKFTVTPKILPPSADSPLSGTGESITSYINRLLAVVKANASSNPWLERILAEVHDDFGTSKDSYLNSPWYLPNGLTINGIPSRSVDFISNGNLILATNYALQSFAHQAIPWFDTEVRRTLGDQPFPINTLLEELLSVLDKSMEFRSADCVVPRIQRLTTFQAGIEKQTLTGEPGSLREKTAEELMKRRLGGVLVADMVTKTLSQIEEALKTEDSFGIFENHTAHATVVGASSTYKWISRIFESSLRMFDVKNVPDTPMGFHITGGSVKMNYHFFPNVNNLTSGEIEARGNDSSNDTIAFPNRHVLDKTERVQLIQMVMSKATKYFNQRDLLAIVDVVDFLFSNDFSNTLDPNSLKWLTPGYTTSLPHVFVLSNQPVAFTTLLRLLKINCFAIQFYDLSADVHPAEIVNSFITDFQWIILDLLDLFGQDSIRWTNHQTQLLEVILDYGLGSMEWYLLPRKDFVTNYESLTQCLSPDAVDKWKTLIDPLLNVISFLRLEGTLIQETKSKVKVLNVLPTSQNAPVVYDFTVDYWAYYTVTVEQRTSKSSVIYKTAIPVPPPPGTPMRRNSRFVETFEIQIKPTLSPVDNHRRRQENLWSSMAGHVPYVLTRARLEKANRSQFEAEIRTHRRRLLRKPLQVFSDYVESVSTKNEDFYPAILDTLKTTPTIPSIGESTIQAPGGFKWFDLVRNKYSDYLVASENGHTFVINPAYLANITFSQDVVDNAKALIDSILIQKKVRPPYAWLLKYYYDSSRFIIVDLTDHPLNWDITFPELDFIILKILQSVFYAAFKKWLRVLLRYLDDKSDQIDPSTGRSGRLLIEIYNDIINNLIGQHLFDEIQGVLIASKSVQLGWNIGVYQKHITESVFPEFITDMKTLVMAFVDRLFNPTCLSLLSFMDYQAYIYRQLIEALPAKTDIQMQLKAMMKQPVLVAGGGVDVTGWIRDVEAGRGALEVTPNQQAHTYTSATHETQTESAYPSTPTTLKPGDAFILYLKSSLIGKRNLSSPKIDESEWSIISSILADVELLSDYFPQLRQEIWYQSFSPKKDWWQALRGLILQYFPIPSFYEETHLLLREVDLRVPANFHSLFRLCLDPVNKIIGLLMDGRKLHPSQVRITPDRPIFFSITAEQLRDKVRYSQTPDPDLVQINPWIEDTKDALLAFPGFYIHFEDADFQHTSWRYIAAQNNPTDRIVRHDIRFLPVCRNTINAVGKNYVLCLWQKINERAKFLLSVADSVPTHNRKMLLEVLDISRDNNHIYYQRTKGSWNIPFTTHAPIDFYVQLEHLFNLWLGRLETHHIRFKNRFGIELYNNDLVPLFAYLLETRPLPLPTILPERPFLCSSKLVDCYFELLQEFVDTMLADSGIRIFTSLFSRVLYLHNADSLKSFIAGYYPSKISFYIIPISKRSGGWELVTVNVKTSTIDRFTYSDLDEGEEPLEIEYLKAFFLDEHYAQKWKIRINYNLRLSSSDPLMAVPVEMEPVVVCAIANHMVFEGGTQAQTMFMSSDVTLLKPSMKPEERDQIVRNYLHYWVKEIALSPLMDTVAYSRFVDTVPAVVQQLDSSPQQRKADVKDILDQIETMESDSELATLTLDKGVNPLTPFLISGDNGLITPNSWITGAIIDGYLTLLTRLAAAREIPIFICLTDFYLDGIGGNITQPESFNLTRVVRQKRRSDYFKKFDRTYHSSLLVPIWTGTHFYCGCVDLEAKKILIYDPLGESSLRGEVRRTSASPETALFHKEDFRNLTILAKSLAEPDSGPYLCESNPQLSPTIPFPYQSDGSSCGILEVIILNLLVTGRNRSLKDNNATVVVNPLGIGFVFPKDVMEFRRIILLDIWNYRITLFEHINPLAKTEASSGIGVVTPVQHLPPGFTPSKKLPLRSAKTITPLPQPTPARLRRQGGGEGSSVARTTTTQYAPVPVVAKASPVVNVTVLTTAEPTPSPEMTVTLLSPVRSPSPSPPRSPQRVTPSPPLHFVQPPRSPLPTGPRSPQLSPSVSPARSPQLSQSPATLAVSPLTSPGLNTNTLTNQLELSKDQLQFSLEQPNQDILTERTINDQYETLKNTLNQLGQQQDQISATDKALRTATLPSTTTPTDSVETLWDELEQLLGPVQDAESAPLINSSIVDPDYLLDVGIENDTFYGRSILPETVTTLSSFLPTATRSGDEFLPSYTFNSDIGGGTSGIRSPERLAEIQPHVDDGFDPLISVEAVDEDESTGLKVLPIPTVPPAASTQTPAHIPYRFVVQPKATPQTPTVIQGKRPQPSNRAPTSPVHPVVSPLKPSAFGRKTLPPSVIEKHRRMRRGDEEEEEGTSPEASSYSPSLSSEGSPEAPASSPLNAVTSPHRRWEPQQPATIPYVPPPLPDFIHQSMEKVSQASQKGTPVRAPFPIIAGSPVADLASRISSSFILSKAPPIPQIPSSLISPIVPITPTMNDNIPSVRTNFQKAVADPILSAAWSVKTTPSTIVPTILLATSGQIGNGLGPVNSTNPLKQPRNSFGGMPTAPALLTGTTSLPQERRLTLPTTTTTTTTIPFLPFTTTAAPTLPPIPPPPILFPLQPPPNFTRDGAIGTQTIAATNSVGGVGPLLVLKDEELLKLIPLIPPNPYTFQSHEDFTKTYTKSLIRKAHSEASPNYTALKQAIERTIAVLQVPGNGGLFEKQLDNESVTQFHAVYNYLFKTSFIPLYETTTEIVVNVIASTWLKDYCPVKSIDEWTPPSDAPTLVKLRNEVHKAFIANIPIAGWGQVIQAKLASIVPSTKLSDPRNIGVLTAIYNQFQTAQRSTSGTNNYIRALGSQELVRWMVVFVLLRNGILTVSGGRLVEKVKFTEYRGEPVLTKKTDRRQSGVTKLAPPRASTSQFRPSVDVVVDEDITSIYFTPLPGSVQLKKQVLIHANINTLSLSDKPSGTIVAGFTSFPKFIKSTELDDPSKITDEILRRRNQIVQEFSRYNIYRAKYLLFLCSWVRQFFNTEGIQRLLKDPTSNARKQIQSIGWSPLFRLQDDGNYRLVNKDIASIMSMKDIPTRATAIQILAFIFTNGKKLIQDDNEIPVPSE